MRTNKTQNKGSGRNDRRILPLLAALLLFCPFLVRAQVTVGDGTPPKNYSILEVVSNGNGGLRLPHLTNAQRNALKDGEGSGAVDFKQDPNRPMPFLYEGLTIYNTDTRCVEYYNAHRWISMCDGTSQMTIGPDPCTSIDADGSGCDGDFEITDPDCVNGPFTFTVIMGADFASLYDVDEAAGTFKISFSPNNSINQRSAVVRVTSSCTSLYKDFLFTQNGQDCDPLLGTAPSITSVPSGKNISFCAGGAVYLSVDANTPNLDELIWTRNGVEIARGVNKIAVTQAGIYDVWMGLIGCHKKDGNAVTVTKDGTGAPSPVDIVVRGNNGLVCGPMGETTLIAQKPAGSGTQVVRWFKDGVLQPLSSPDNEIVAGIGQWFAVVNAGTCWSTPSETVTVSLDPNAGNQLDTPAIKYGNFCAGGSALLEVTNAQTGYTYEWYENNTLLGTGTAYLYNVPTNATSVVIRCRATQAGGCASETSATETISTTPPPGRPSITGDRQLCSNVANLDVQPAVSGTYTYQWYKDGVPYSTSKEIKAFEGGTYSVTVTETGGCTSPAASRTIDNTSSAVPTVTLSRTAETPNQYDVVTYMATIDFGPAIEYEWTVTNATLISGGTANTANAVVEFDQTGPASVEVKVTNACGFRMATHSVINVQPDCISPDGVSPSTDSRHETFVNEPVTTFGRVSASFPSGSPATSFQWYKSDVPFPYNWQPESGTGATSDYYSPINNNAGTYYYHCKVGNASCTNDTEMASGVYTVVVSPDPGTLKPGTGTFSGKTCFDVAMTNNGDGCGDLGNRQNGKADFSNPATHTQTYTFTTSGTVSKIRFLYKNAGDEVIESITPLQSNAATGTNLNGNFTVRVKYKEDLNAKAAGTSRDQAMKATLYVVYDPTPNGTGTADLMHKLEISVQDCVCCPGYLAVGGEYKRKTAGYLTQFNDGAKITTVKQHYEATGNDLCFYKSDAKNSASISWYEATAAGRGNLCGTDNTYVGAEFRGMGGWRLPTLAEMGSLQNIYSTIHLGQNAMTGTTILRNAGYWTQDQRSSSHSWLWRFNNATAGYTNHTHYLLLRCARSM